MTRTGRSTVKAFVKAILINLERKWEYRRRLETAVVPTVNDTDLLFTISLVIALPWEASLQRNQSQFRGKYGCKAET